MDLLNEAIQRAKRLVAELNLRQAEVQANPPHLPPDKLAEGRQAMTKALEAARRTLKALEEAREIAAGDIAQSASEPESNRDSSN